MRQAQIGCGGWAVVLMFCSLAAAEPRVPATWNLDELKAPPAVTWGETKDGVRSLYYAGEPYQGKPTRVFAYYAEPAKHDGKLPAMVLVHGGGGKAFKEWAKLWADRGYAAIAMDLAGCGPDGQRLPDGGPDQQENDKFQVIAGGVKNAWPYHAVANVIRGVSLIGSLEQVDPERIGVTGISWGGYLTCIVAGVDDRLKVAVPVYGCGFLQDNSCWLPTFAKLPEDQRKLWHDAFDPSQYLPGAELPMLFVNGTNDFAYPLDSYQKSYRVVPGPRNLCVTVAMPHGHPPGWAPVEIGLFVDSVLTGGKPLAQWKSVERNGAHVAATIESSTPLTKAELHYTTDAGRWQDRKWTTVPAKLDAGVASAELPNARPLVWFLTATDERGARVSTEHQEIK